MATAIPGLRWVRCPKCMNVLTEFANVPFYKCGVCGTTLRSKHYKATVEDSTDAPQEISSQNQPDSSSFNEGSTSRNEMTVSPSENRAQDVASPSPQVSNMDAPTEGAELKHEESCSKDRAELKLNDETQGLAESSVRGSASLEDKENRNVLRSYSSVSYAGDGSDGGTPRKRVSLALSRRTFRVRKVQDSEDTSADKGEGIKEMVAATQVQAQAQDVLQPTKENPDAIDRLNSVANECSQKERDHAAKDPSLDVKDFESVQNLMESENHGPSESPSRDAQVCRGSAKNQTGSVSTELKSLGRIQMKILRKVDELREEINEIFEKSDEGKGRYHRKTIREENQIKNRDSAFAQRPPKPPHQRKDIPRPSRFADIPSALHHIPCKHCQHATCGGYRNGFCTACHHDRTCKPSATCGPRNHVDPRVSPSRHESRIEHEPERSYNKERRQQKKRPCRPVLGGAPFVICYNCLELLKLPIDFFIVSKRLYKLQCGACSKVLTYSFRSRNQGIPDTPNEAETPTTEVESQGTSGREMLNHHMNGKSQWDPVSYSEEYGLSLGISYSTDAELPEQRQSSSQAMAKRYSKAKTGSELHMLMGYGSASELLYRHSDIDEESEITEATSPLCNTPESTFAGNVMKRRGSYVSDPSTSRYY